MIVGSVIGILCGSVSYLMYWPNPLSSKNMTDRIAEEPIYVYGRQPDAMQSSDYELASAEDGAMQV